MKPRLILRADGNYSIGLGHIYRLLALVSLLKDKFECVFFIQVPNDNLKQIITSGGAQVVSLEYKTKEEKEFMMEMIPFINKEDIVILDGYYFDTGYQKNIKETGCRLICIDDIHAFKFVADVVINHAGGLSPEDYQKAPYTKLLLGPAYAILRKEFYEHQRKAKLDLGNQVLFINMGGSDEPNNTLKVLQELKKLTFKFERIIVVIGAAYLHGASLFSYAESLPTIEIHQNINTNQMITLMEASNTAVCSASTISYEYCSLGGLLFLLQTADNQFSIYQYLINQDLALSFNQMANVFNQNQSLEYRKKVMTMQRNIFDGKAGERLVKNIGS